MNTALPELPEPPKIAQESTGCMETEEALPTLLDPAELSRSSASAVTTPVIQAYDQLDAAPPKPQLVISSSKNKTAKAPADLDSLFSMTLNWSLEEVKREEKKETYVQKMSCPKCGFEQPKADLCSQCGVNILEYAAYLQEQLMIQAGEYRPLAELAADEPLGDEEPEGFWQRLRHWWKGLWNRQSLNEELLLAQQAGLLSDDLKNRRQKQAETADETPKQAGEDEDKTDRNAWQRLLQALRHLLILLKILRPQLFIPDAPQEILWDEAQPAAAENPLAADQAIAEAVTAAEKPLPQKNSNPILAAAERDREQARLMAAAAVKTPEATPNQEPSLPLLALLA